MVNIRGLIFALFHMQSYSGGFIEAYKEYRKTKKLFKMMLKHSKLRQKMLGLIQKSASELLEDKTAQ